jgi:hypothetical protein
MVGLERGPLFARVFALVGYSGVPENAIFGANMLTSRRSPKNIGGRIAPAAIAGLIEGAPCSVNVFRAFRGRKADLANADKVLMRLNFSGSAANG